MSVFPYFLPLQGTDMYTQLSSTSTRNNYTRPQLLNMGFYTTEIWNSSFERWPYQLHLFHIWTSNTSAIPGHFTSHIWYKYATARKQCHEPGLSQPEILHKFFKPNFGQQLPIQTTKRQILHNFFQHSIIITPNVIHLLPPRQNHNYIIIYFPQTWQPLPKTILSKFCKLKTVFKFSQFYWLYSKWKENFDENQISLETKDLTLHSV